MNPEVARIAEVLHDAGIESAFGASFEHAAIYHGADAERLYAAGLRLPEPPATGLDVERLARAFDLNGVNWPRRWGDNDFAWLARQVAAEYARLTAEDAP